MMRSYCLSCLLLLGCTVGAMQRPARRSVIDEIFGISRLHTAALEGNLREVRALLGDPKVDVNARDRVGDTPLHLAARQDRQAVVHELLQDARVDINAQNNDGDTPLHHAAMGCERNQGTGSLAAARELLTARGIRFDIRNRSGTTPIDIARHRNRQAFIRLVQSYMTNENN